MADVVEDIKSRLGIAELIGQYIPLKKAGVNFKACCPFHGEKTASFVVSPEKQIFHCFGCQKGGDIFTFIQEYEGVDFSESLHILGDKAGVKVEKASKALKGRSKGEKEVFYKAHDLACEKFEKNLYGTNDGKKVLEYLYKRGLTDETIKEFRVGFSVDKYDDLYPHLLKKGVTKKVLMSSGFVSSKNMDADSIYDKFRGRLMMPIFDYLGRICGFGGRALKKDQMPKYLNSPENIIYNKSKVLYGLSHAKQEVKAKDLIVLVEGYFDVLLPHQEGVKNVVAVSGTALTDGHISLIKRITSNVVTCFDLDAAGFEATRRSYNLLQKGGFSTKTLAGFEGKDPADFVKENGGEAFEEILKKANYFVAFYIDKLCEDNDFSTIGGRRNILSELLPILKNMAASDTDYYVRELSKKLGIQERFLYDEIDQFKLPANHPARQVINSAKKIERIKMSIFEELLAIVLEFPVTFKGMVEIVAESDFDDQDKAIYKALTDQYNSARADFAKWNLNLGFLASIRGRLNVLSLYAGAKYEGFSVVALSLELEKLIDKSRNDRRSRRLKGIQSNIQEAEEAGDKERLLQLLVEQQEIFKEQNQV